MIEIPIWLLVLLCMFATPMLLLLCIIIVGLAIDVIEVSFEKEDKQ